LSFEPQRWVVLAHILRPRGNKGEVAAEVLTDFPERLGSLRQVFLGHASGEGSTPHPAALRSCWLNPNHPTQAVFHFEGCSSISQAEQLRGLDVLVPLEQRVPLPAGRYFVSDLVGCSVFECRTEVSKVYSSPCSLASAPEALGVVREVQFTGESVAGTPVLAVEAPQGEILIPFAEDICKRIDVAARRIEVLLPEGLRELNAEDR
jgi:16S rRNA processing protein RimM